jgi:hypothetical protein
LQHGGGNTIHLSVIHGIGDPAPVIERDILLVTNGHPVYRAFARGAGITHRAVNLSAGVRVAGALHLQNVNANHSRFKQWLRRFHGVATRYLPNYLGWRWAVDGGRIGSPEMLLRSALSVPSLCGDIAYFLTRPALVVRAIQLHHGSL